MKLKDQYTVQFDPDEILEMRRIGALLQKAARHLPECEVGQMFRDVSIKLALIRNMCKEDGKDSEAGGR